LGGYRTIWVHGGMRGIIGGIWEYMDIINNLKFNFIFYFILFKVLSVYNFILKHIKQIQCKIFIIYLIYDYLFG